jgi:hypothetical protein
MRTNENGQPNARGRRDVDALLVAALAFGASYADAARVAGVSKATVARRMSEVPFRARVLEEREQRADRVRGVLMDASLRAAESLAELANGAESESVRLAAAARVIDLALRRRPGFDTFSHSEVVDIIRRVADLALERLPDEQAEGFVLEVRALGTSTQ